MSTSRRPLSLLTALALGLGAALLVLFAGGAPAAAAPAPAGLNPPLPNNCYARDDSNTATVYSSADSAAVRSAVAAAVTSDTIRLAGTCNGVAAQGGTTQTVLINKPLTLIGGYTATDWINTFPITQPTVLDAQDAGRVITASADITLSGLTIQHGDSFGGDGGGIFAGSNMTLMGVVNILSNTTSASTTTNPAGGQSRAPAAPPAGDGGGAYVEKHAWHGLVPSPPDLPEPIDFEDNSASNGGGLYDNGNGHIVGTEFSGNTASQAGGGVYGDGTMLIDSVHFDDNTAVNGGGFYLGAGATLSNILCHLNQASYSGGCGAVTSSDQEVFDHFTVVNNTAQYGAGLTIFGPNFYLSRSNFADNTASVAAGGVLCEDSTCNLKNITFMRNTAPEAANLAVMRNFSPYPYILQAFLEYVTAIKGAPDAALQAATAGASVNPLAPSSVLTGSAFSATGAGLVMSDTIIYGYALDLETGSAPSSTISGDYNLFDTTPVISGTNITTGTHSLVGDPLFADAAGHLSAGSPAIDHGIDVGVNVDLDGNPRPSGHGFDIGAYEFQVALAKLFLPFVRR